MDRPCPCHSGHAFAACCEPYLSGAAIAPTAVALMRSRYAAFREGAADYLVATHHPSARAADERAELQRSIAGTDWVNLVIVDTQNGSEGDAKGDVEFVAAFRQKRPAIALGAVPAPEVGQMHERSFFVREDGRWLYVDGEQLPAYRAKRNDPCWCGSGRKAKQCHG